MARPKKNIVEQETTEMPASVKKALEFNDKSAAQQLDMIIQEEVKNGNIRPLGNAVEEDNEPITLYQEDFSANSLLKLITNFEKEHSKFSKVVEGFAAVLNSKIFEEIKDELKDIEKIKNDDEISGNFHTQILLKEINSCREAIATLTEHDKRPINIEDLRILVDNMRTTLASIIVIKKWIDIISKNLPMRPESQPMLPIGKEEEEKEEGYVFGHSETHKSYKGDTPEIESEDEASQVTIDEDEVSDPDAF